MKETSRTGRELEYSDTTQHVKTRIAERYMHVRTSFFEGNAPRRYIELGLKAKESTPLTLKLPRKTLGYLLASRTGHGAFSQYHTRFKNLDSEHKRVCGSIKTAEHFIYYRKGRQLATLTSKGLYEQ